MKYKFWGVRGSIPTPGSDTVRYGGNTACSELTLGDDNMIIFDAGSGIRVLGNDLMKRGKPVKAAIFLTHTHWDHIQGFPFFVPAFIPGNKFIICGCGEADVSLEKIFLDQMKSAYFPVELSDMPASIGFKNMDEGTYKISGCVVKTMYVNHPGFTLGYRIEHDGKSLVYISDNEPYPMEESDSPDLENLKYKNKNNLKLAEFAKDADLFIHDCQYTPEEYESKKGWGHSPYDYVAELAIAANVKKFAVFHHDPMHDDKFVDEIVEKVRDLIHAKNDSIEVIGAAEEMEIEI